MTLTHKIAKHTTIQVVGRLIGFILGLISIIFLTRYLGTDGFGKYVTITVFVNAVAVFADFGTEQVFIKEYFKTNKKKWLLANTFSLKIFFALIIFIVGVLIGHFFPYAAVVKTGIWIYSLAAFIIAVEGLFVDLFQINLKMHYAVIAEMVNRIISVILIILSVYFNLGLLFIIFSLALGSAMQFLLAYIWADRMIKIRFGFNFKLWKSLLTKAIPIGISAVLCFVYYKVDTIILSVLKPSYDVGIYGVSYKLLDIVVMFPGLFCGLVFPVLANVFAQNRMTRFNKLIQKGFDVLVITGIPITIILFGLSKPLILLVAGNQYLPSIPVLKILSFSAMLIYINWIFLTALIGGDKQKNLILPLVLLSLFNIILNLILIPPYSYIGAAIATVATQLLALIIPWVLAKKLFNIKISLINTLKAIIAGAIMLLVLFIIQNWDIGINWHELENISTFYRLCAVTIVALLGSVIYLGVLGATGALKKSIIMKIINS